MEFTYIATLIVIVSVIAYKLGVSVGHKKGLNARPYKDRKMTLD